MNPNPKQENLKPWEKGQSGNPDGRPKKLFSHIIDQLKTEGYKRVSPAQVSEAYELIMNLDEAKIKLIEDDKEAPMLMRVVAKRILDKKGDMDMLEKVIDRAHGKAKQKIDVTDDTHLAVPNITLNVIQQTPVSPVTPSPDGTEPKAE